MKKFTCLSYTKNAITIGLYLLLWFAVLFAGGLVSDRMLIFMIAYAIFAVYIIMIEIVFYKNTYTVIKMTKEGVGNKYIFFKWSEIKSFTVKELRSSRFKRVLYDKKDDIVCIGEFTEGGLWEQDPKKCVCFTLSKKNIRVLRALCKEPCEAVEAIIGWKKTLKKYRSDAPSETIITTYTKKPLDPLAPKAELLDIRDIAHALSMMCRANGHFPVFYSVAQHSLNCMKEAKARGLSERVQLACLLHDASEAYISDVTRPVKSALPEYKRIEKTLETSIYEKWMGGITAEEYTVMREIDDILLYHEFFRFMGEKLWEEEPKLYSKPHFFFELFGGVEKEFTAAFASLQTACEAGGKENVAI